MKERLKNENIHDYAIRLYTNKKEYGLNSVSIADLLNKETGLEKTESAWRKRYRAFMDGMNYAVSQNINNVAERILCVSDCHVPFQLPIENLAKFKDKVDTLVLNGDIGDCQSISSFPKVYRKSPMEEMIETRKYMIDMIEYIKPKKVVINYGNHDLRFQSYLAKNLDSDIFELMPQTSLELIVVDGFNHYNKEDKTKVYYSPIKDVFKDIEIVYTDDWKTQIGSVVFAHPKAFSSGILKTAEKAMGWFRNEGYVFDTLVMAHTHRIGSFYVGNTVLYEQGAFSDVKKNNYSDGKLYNSQKEGFIYLCLDKDGKCIKDKTELVVLN